MAKDLGRISVVAREQGCVVRTLYNYADRRYITLIYFEGEREPFIDRNELKMAYGIYGRRKMRGRYRRPNVQVIPRHPIVGTISAEEPSA